MPLEFHYSVVCSLLLRLEHMHPFPCRPIHLRVVLTGLALLARSVICAQTTDSTADAYPRAASTWLDVQVALARRGFSGGSIDGIRGPQSVAALQAYQRREGLESSGELDPATREKLVLDEPALSEVSLTETDLASLRPVPVTWLEKSRFQPSLKP